MAVLSQDELEEAVKEWMRQRGLPESDDIEFFGSSGPGYATTQLREIYAKVKDLEMPVKEGPYR